MKKEPLKGKWFNPYIMEGDGGGELSEESVIYYDDVKSAVAWLKERMEEKLGVRIMDSSIISHKDNRFTESAVIMLGLLNEAFPDLED